MQLFVRQKVNEGWMIATVLSQRNGSSKKLWCQRGIQNHVKHHEKMLLTIFTKNYILDVWQGSENAFGSILKIYLVSEIARLGNCMRQRVLNVNSFFPIPYKTNL